MFDDIDTETMLDVLVKGIVGFIIAMIALYVFLVGGGMIAEKFFLN